MAIKSGAFDLYVQERQLPKKSNERSARKTHFFDNVIGNDIGSQMVHNRFTDSEQKLSVASGEPHHKESLEEVNNGSQTVHERFTSEGQKLLSGYESNCKPVDLDSKNGSQSVHNRFTDGGQESSVASDEPRHNESLEEVNNGSRTVHERFTSEERKLLSGYEYNCKPVDLDSKNGSQMVHNRFTDGRQESSVASDELRHNESLEEVNHGSQTVHNRFTDGERKSSVASDEPHQKKFLEEVNNGSQTVHNNFIDKNVVISYEKQEPSLPEIKFSRLIGNQRDVVLAIYKNIQMNELHTTKELTLDEISLLSNVNKKSLKNTLFRLVSAGFIRRSDQKIGRGGWVKYELNSDLKDEIKNIGIFSMVKKK